MVGALEAGWRAQRGKGGEDYLPLTSFPRKAASLGAQTVQRPDVLSLFKSCPTLRLCGPGPVKLLCRWVSPDRNTGGDCHAVLQGIFPTQSLLPAGTGRQVLDHSCHPESSEDQTVKIKRSLLIKENLPFQGAPWWLRQRRIHLQCMIPGSIPGSGRPPEEANGNPLQYSCLENPYGQRSLAGYSPWS